MSDTDSLRIASDVLIRATIALVAGAAGALALRRASAAARHLAWGLTFAALVAIPALRLGLPGWPVVVGRTAAAVPARIESPRPVAVVFEEPARGPVTSPVREAPKGVDRGIGLAIAEPSTPPIGRPRPGPTLADRLIRFGGAAWGAGVLVILGRLAAGLAGLGRPAVGPASAALIDRARRVCGGAFDPSRVRLGQGDRDLSPMTWGVVRPVIALPSAADEWTDERLRSVLLHEQAHIARGDWLWQVLARAACGLYWFHPLAWLAERRLRVEAERACDDLVLAAGTRPTDYADDLLAIASTPGRTRRGLGVALPMARGSQFERRLVALLDDRTRRGPVSPRLRRLAVAAVAALLVPLSVARPMSSPEAAPAVAADAGPRMTVTGRVVGPDGAAAGGAEVAIVGRLWRATLDGRSGPQVRTLGRATADADGRFRLDAPRTSWGTYSEVKAIAHAAGRGLGWAEVDRDAESPTVDIALRPERVVEGRLVDDAGAPAAGVTLEVTGLGISRPEIRWGFDGVNPQYSPRDLAGLWPGPVVTDADGRFRLPGVGEGVDPTFATDDARFARQYLRLAASEPRPATMKLAPALVVSGRVTAADTGNPIGDAVVLVNSSDDSSVQQGFPSRTDADGRYAIRVRTGVYVEATVYPPDGSPYPVARRNLKGGERRDSVTLDLDLARGVPISGRVTEQGTGRPLAGAYLYWDMDGPDPGFRIGPSSPLIGWEAAVLTDAEGRYRTAVPPVRGMLVIHGPSADFVQQVRGAATPQGIIISAQRLYAHAFVRHDAKPGAGDVTLDASLQRGVTITGRVVGLDGTPVARAEILSSLLISPSHGSWRGDFTVPVRDGRFVLRGLPPQRPCYAYVLDAEGRAGATVRLTGEMAERGPILVRLQPAGRATARLVGLDGRPIAGASPALSIVATPGPPPNNQIDKIMRFQERVALAADEESYVNVDRQNYWKGPRSDADGRVTLPGLIPGATYRTIDWMDVGTARWRDFAVEPGATVDLGEIRIPPPR